MHELEDKKADGQRRHFRLQGMEVLVGIHSAMRPDAGKNVETEKPGVLVEQEGRDTDQDAEEARSWVAGQSEQVRQTPQDDDGDDPCWAGEMGMEDHTG